jgi:hypothetical protein
MKITHRINERKLSSSAAAAAAVAASTIALIEIEFFLSSSFEA